MRGIFEGLNWLKYRVWKPIEFHTWDFIKRETFRGAAAGARGAWNVSQGAFRNRGLGDYLKRSAREVRAGASAGYRVFRNWGMGGRPLFYEVPNEARRAAERAGASQFVLDKLPHGDNILTFNIPLRKKIAFGVGAIGVLSAIRGAQGHDPLVAGESEDIIQYRESLNADGEMALSMYYNNR